MWRDRIVPGCWTLILLLLLMGCSPSAGAADLSASLPAVGDAPGWTPEGDVRAFDEETLFGLVNGQAEVFFAYGFERSVRRPPLRLHRRGPAAARLSNAHLDSNPNPDADVYSNAEANRHSDLNNHPNADLDGDAGPNTHKSSQRSRLTNPGALR